MAEAFPRDFQHLINQLRDEDDVADLIEIQKAFTADRKRIEELIETVKWQGEKIIRQHNNLGEYTEMCRTEEIKNQTIADQTAMIERMKEVISNCEKLLNGGKSNSDVLDYIQGFTGNGSPHQALKRKE